MYMEFRLSWCCLNSLASIVRSIYKENCTQRPRNGLLTTNGGMLPSLGSYRLFRWPGFPKRSLPLGTRLCEAKCSMLYALSALYQGGKRHLKRQDCFHQQTACIWKPRPLSHAPTCGQSVPTLWPTPRKVAGQRATFKAEMNRLSPSLDRRPLDFGAFVLLQLHWLSHLIACLCYLSDNLWFIWFMVLGT